MFRNPIDRAARAAGLAVCLAVVTACGGSGSNDGASADDEQAATTEVAGGAAKGPLANAAVEVFTLDPEALDGQGVSIATGNTDGQANLTDLAIPDDTSGLLLFVFRATDDTRDLSTGQVPIIQRMTTIVPAADVINDGRRVFATLLTTVTVEIALANMDTPAFGGNGDGTVDSGEMNAALDAAVGRTKSLFGFGLLAGIDLLTTPPWLLEGVTDDRASQEAVTRYRSGIEALGCLADEVARAIDLANSGSTSTTADVAFKAIVKDVADGRIDASAPDGAISVYGANGLAAATEVIEDSPADCPIPNEANGRTVGQIAEILVAEIDATGNQAADTGDVIPPEWGAGRSRSDIDGDGTPDGTDSDIDGDGTPNADDDMPLVPDDGSTGNARPFAADDTATVDEDASVTIDVLANDSDVDGSLEPATVAVVADASDGTTSVDTATGEIRYTPDSDFDGSDSFSYTVDDNGGDTTNTATVSVGVNPVNDDPVAADDSVTVDEDTSVPVNVLANDSDIDGNLDPGSVKVDSAASNGTTSVDTVSGEIRYTPDTDFNGSDSFGYTVADNSGATSNTATVSVDVNPVNDAPVAVDDSATVNEDTSVTIEVLANDSDTDGSLDPTRVTVVTGASNGAISVDTATGEIRYTPDANFSGTDSFGYNVDDDNGVTSNTATVSVDINPVNDIPFAADDGATVDEDDSVTIDVLANDGDIDGSLDPASVTVVAGASDGTTSVDAATGAIEYIPDADFNGSDSFGYTVADDDGATSDPATVSVDINPVNDAPVAADNSGVVDQGASVTIDVLANDSDIDGGLDPASVTVATAAGNGTTSVDTATGAITYTPDSGFNGSDGFTYTVADDSGAESNTATVSVDVEAVISLAIDVSFPTSNANLGDVDQISVSGKLTNTDGSAVAFSDVNFIDVNGEFATQEAEDSSLWTLSSLDTGNATPFDVTAMVESDTGHTDTLTQSLSNRLIVPSPVDITVDAANGRVLLLDRSLGAVVLADPVSGDRSILSDANTGAGPDFSNPVSGALDADNGRVLVLDDFIDTVFAVELDTGDRSILSDSNTGAGPEFGVPTALTLDADNNRVLVADGVIDGIVAVDLGTGDRTIVSGRDPLVGAGPHVNGPRSLTLDADNGRALVVDDSLDAVFSVDLSTGDRTIVSDSTTGAGPAFGRPFSLVLDAANGRAVVADLELGAVIAVDLATGDRSIFSGNGTGTGPDLYFPRSLALDTTNSRMLMVDSGLDAVVTVDLNTGDRGIVLDNSTASGPAFISPRTVTLDPDNGRALVVDVNRLAVLTVNPGTGDRGILSDSSTGVGPDLGGAQSLTLDTGNHRALVVLNTFNSAAMIAVDLTSGDRSILSDGNTGSGPAFDSPRSVVLDAGNDRALVADNGLDAVVAVDLGSGNRAILSDGNTGLGLDFNNPVALAMDADNDRVLVLDNFTEDAVFAVDLNSGNRSIVSDSNKGSGPNLEVPTSIALDVIDGRALVSDQSLGAVVAVDLGTGDRNILSDATNGSGPDFLSPQSIAVDEVNHRAFVADAILSGVVVINLMPGAPPDRALGSR